MTIIKRNGTEVDFDVEKIFAAIQKANTAGTGTPELSGDKVGEIAVAVEKTVKALGRTSSVEEIQELVETELMKAGSYETAKRYIRYRYNRSLVRRSNTTDEKILSLIECCNEEVKQENSNKNPVVNSTQRDYMAGEVSRDISERLLLPADIVEAHKEGIIHFHDSDYFAQHMHNCFSSATRFVTDRGIVSFRDCRDGMEVKVLCMDGAWRSATVHKYERQKLYDVRMHSARSSRVVTCTRDHRWILKDGSITTNLKIGDVLYALPETVNAEIETDRDKEMFALGMILGDGCDTARGWRIALCGGKTQYAWIFSDLGYHLYTDPHGRIICNLKTEMSKQSFLSDHGWHYLSQHDKAMLFYGYYAADGAKGQNFIATADERLLDMVIDISAIAGYHVSSIREITRDTNYKLNVKLYEIRFRVRQNENNCWKIDRITEHRRGSTGDALQECWCVEEPVTHSFTLEGGIITGNCDLVNLEDMLQNGTVISGTMIERPHRFSTACNIATQIIAQVASNQYGGQSISLTHLAPFVDISRKEIRKKLERDFADIGLNIGPEQIDILVEKQLREEIRSGVQTIQYQILTLLTTNGQTPFVTVYMYLNEARSEQEKHDLAVIIQETLEQRYQGVKNESGVWVTPAFPKLIYVLEEDNIREGTPYWYLTKLAAKCTARRMVPDYISEKKMLELKGDVYTCMGCRSFLTPDRFTDAGIGNIANAKNYLPGQHKYYGRFNQGVVTLNLPDVALSSGGDFQKFWDILDERLELCHRALLCRHERLKGTISDVSPILWQYGALARLEKGEVIDRLLFDGYSTISLGFAGLYECVKYMTGESHTDPEAKPFAIFIMERLNDACKTWKAEHNVDFSLYGTPLESTTYKFAKALQRRFGIIPGVTDKNYITNSYHVHVTEPINAFEKLRFESEFQALSPGGAISYVEVPNMQNNLEAVLRVIQFIYDNIIYAELNTKSDYCQCCGWDGEIEIVEVNGKLMWRCPQCGNMDQSKMNVARRTCGYIGSQFWNQGRTQEIRDRVLHL